VKDSGAQILNPHPTQPYAHIRTLSGRGRVNKTSNEQNVWRGNVCRSQCRDLENQEAHQELGNGPWVSVVDNILVIPIPHLFCVRAWGIHNAKTTTGVEVGVVWVGTRGAASTTTFPCLVVAERLDSPLHCLQSPHDPSLFRPLFFFAYEQHVFVGFLSVQTRLIECLREA